MATKSDGVDIAPRLFRDRDAVLRFCESNPKAYLTSFHVALIWGCNRSTAQKAMDRCCKNMIFHRTLGRLVRISGVPIDHKIHSLTVNNGATTRHGRTEEYKISHLAFLWGMSEWEVGQWLKRHRAITKERETPYSIAKASVPDNHPPEVRSRDERVFRKTVDPTPDEIQARIQEIQDTWDEETRESRRVQKHVREIIEYSIRPEDGTGSSEDLGY